MNIKLPWLLLLFFVCTGLTAQKKILPGKIVIENALKEIKDFETKEKKLDSIAGKPLGSNKEEDYLRRYTFYRSVNAKLDKINKVKLALKDQINLELLKHALKDELSQYQFKAYLNPILSDAGFHTWLPFIAREVFSTKKEYEDYIKKLKDIPRYVNEYIDLMRKGLDLGISQPGIILTGYENTYEQHIVSEPAKSVFWKPFTMQPKAIDKEEWGRLTIEGAGAVMQFAVEGFRKLKAFFDEVYLARARTTTGVSHFPDGLAWYQDRTTHFTSTDLSYEEIYQIGLKEVERIKLEMLNTINQAKFTGTLKEFIHYLRTDPKFYATTPEQLLKEASFIAKKADGMLPSLFGKLPRQPYGIEPVPAHLAPTYTAGRYSGAPISGKRAGNYWVNTHKLESRPLYALESLTLHEAVPGHHLQIALTQELSDLPEFRRDLYINAFGEGWGLYSEYLGTEMGFYKDPYSLFGKLTYEMWRACRLVIDVGLHAKGWTRDQAVAYLSDHTALSLHEVNTEINRYISWPGQALAYKVGELKIKELRKRAEERLNEKFDIREFHDTVLSQGTVTLKILEIMIDNYIQKKT